MGINSNHQNDIDELINFLNLTESIINELVENKGNFVLAVFAKNKKFKNIMKSAWDDAQKNLIDVREKIKQSKAIQWEKLKKVGLTDNQLRFKMDLFKRLYKKFRGRESSTELRRLLGCINSVLGSLSNMFPKIETISEIKDMIEQIIRVNRPRPRNQ